MSIKFDVPGQLKRIAQVFTPESSIKAKEFFIGRKSIINDCLSIIDRPGAHIAIYGNRGVGKTSLATVLEPLYTEHTQLPIYFKSCDSVDSFESLWLKIFEDIVLHPKYEDSDENDTQSEPFMTEEVYKHFGVNEVLNVLKSIGSEAIIILDEFDRLESAFDMKLFSDTIKSLSDKLPNVTLIIVGVGENIVDLVGEHPSIERNLIQVPLLEMENPELRLIITNGLEMLTMNMEPHVIDKIVRFSCGYPYFTHLLALHACRSAVLRGRMEVLDNPDFHYAVSAAIRQSLESLRKAYSLATGSNRESIYEEVLWAVALADCDEQYTFQPKDLLIPLAKILKKPEVKYYSFIGHLTAFCSEDRGRILEKTKSKKRVRYKLRDPRMRAFILLKYQEYVKKNQAPTYGQLDIFGNP
ncbi:MAG: ATP-binding protein [Ignavibacteriae bacterium]|nr:MAG: ATP-binding protein [Ignavibacteriota bacterium]